MLGVGPLLQELADKGAKGRLIVARETERAALQVVNHARTNAPKDTSTLARSIHVSGIGSDSHTTQGGKGRRRNTSGMTINTSLSVPSPSDLERVVGTNVKYAMRMEYGFSGTDRRGRTYNQAGHYYMTRAVNAAQEEYAMRLRAKLEAAL